VAFIQDTGCGMSNETMDNMWKPFFTTKKSGKGTGLGMAIVKNVLEAHQAKISVSSKLGEGTIFEIRFEPVKE
jgi:signal transduction histidine kinase